MTVSAHNIVLTNSSFPGQPLVLPALDSVVLPLKEVGALAQPRPASAPEQAVRVLLTRIRRRHLLDTRRVFSTM